MLSGRGKRRCCQPPSRGQVAAPGPACVRAPNRGNPSQTTPCLQGLTCSPLTGQLALPPEEGPGPGSHYNITADSVSGTVPAPHGLTQRTLTMTLWAVSVSTPYPPPRHRHGTGSSQSGLKVTQDSSPRNVNSEPRLLPTALLTQSPYLSLEARHGFFDQQF